jgi:hypothetical protein
VSAERANLSHGEITPQGCHNPLHLWVDASRIPWRLEAYLGHKNIQHMVYRTSAAEVQGLLTLERITKQKAGQGEQARARRDEKYHGDHVQGSKGLAGGIVMPGR